MDLGPSWVTKPRVTAQRTRRFFPGVRPRRFSGEQIPDPLDSRITGLEKESDLLAFMNQVFDALGVRAQLLVDRSYPLIDDYPLVYNPPVKRTVTVVTPAGKDVRVNLGHELSLPLTVRRLLEACYGCPLGFELRGKYFVVMRRSDQYPVLPVAYYPVGDLLASWQSCPPQNGPDASDARFTLLLRGLIERTVRTGAAWESTGGAAAMECDPTGALLIVWQTPDGHFELAHLLASLRKLTPRRFQS